MVEREIEKIVLKGARKKGRETGRLRQQMAKKSTRILSQSKS